MIYGNQPFIISHHSFNTIHHFFELSDVTVTSQCFIHLHQNDFWLMLDFSKGLPPTLLKHSLQDFNKVGGKSRKHVFSFTSLQIPKRILISEYQKSLYTGVYIVHTNIILQYSTVKTLLIIIIINMLIVQLNWMAVYPYSHKYVNVQGRSYLKA